MSEVCPAHHWTDEVLAIPAFKKWWAVCDIIAETVSRIGVFYTSPEDRIGIFPGPVSLSVLACFGHRTYMHIRPIPNTQPDRT